MKKVMPYVQMVKERYELIGERALSLTSPFDEMKILKENSDYITGTLELQGINVSTTYQNVPFLGQNVPFSGLKRIFRSNTRKKEIK